ncbi:MAG: hypothetical protein ACRDIC_06120 [bacterium]
MADLGSLLGGAGIGGVIGQALVQLELETKKYLAEMQAAKTETTASTKTMGTSFSNLGGLAKVAFAAVGVAAVAGIALSIKAASDLGEQLNKTKVVFGDTSTAVIKFAKGAAESFGLSERAALEAAGGFGQMLDAAGIAADETGKLSIKLVGLAGDLASFNNVDPTVALEKLRAGLAGEAEPLRQFGVFISEARVQAEALTLGIAKQGEELTDAQKIQARYSLILQDTTKAQGDFGRTLGESLPNQMRVFKAELENVAAALGKAFLPVMTELLKLVRGLIPMLKFVADNIVLIIAALAGFAAVKYVPGLLLGIASGLEAIAYAAGSKAFLSLAIGATSGAAAITALSTVLTATAIPTLGALALAWGIAKVSAGEFSEQVEHVTKVLDDQGIAGAKAVERQDEVNKSYVRALGPATLLHEALDKQTFSMLAMNPAQEQIAEGYRMLADRAEFSIEKVKKSQEAVVNFAHKTDEELKKWKMDIKDSFNTAIFVLEDLTEKTGITRQDVIGNFDMMRDRAHALARAMREIAKEKWINDQFVAFLSEQGPEWMIGFTKLTEDEQRKAQKAWQESTRETNQAKESLDRITGVLEKMDKGNTKHTVEIQYKYSGFDPTKPGMGSGRIS